MTDYSIDTTDLEVRIEGRVGIIAFNRPEARNALSPSMFDAFGKLLPKMAADNNIGVVMITGNGGSFCAGGDVKSMAARKASGEPGSVTFEDRVADLRFRQRQVSLAIHELPKPVIAAIPGPVAGAGLSIALACDLRIMAERAFMTTAFAKVGFSGDFGGSWFLSQLVGTAKARELYYTAARVNAADALALGLTNRVSPDDTFEADALAFANELASGPPIAMRYMKENLNRALHHDLAECLDGEAIAMSRAGQTEDHREAARAFVEKRNPEFHGR